MRIGSLFSGAGGADLAVAELLGATVCFHVESDPAASAVLAKRWPGVLNLGDITTVDWTEEVWHRWPAGIDCIVGGFPCQDISCGAAGRRAGMAQGTRSGLWAYMADAIEALRPALVFIENVRGLLYARAHRTLEPRDPDLDERATGSVLRAAGAVCGDLATLGYDASWVTLPARDVGAPHIRERVFILAHEPGWQWPGDPPRARLPRVRNLHQLLPTPAASDASGGGASPERREGHGHQLIDFALLHGTKRWERYQPALDLWAELTRPAPPVTVVTTRGNRKLNPAFAEWMLGWPPGHVTDLLPQRDALRIIGNGCCPQQAELALARLLEVRAA